MGLLRGRIHDEGYQPSWLHDWLKPDISGNAINGLGETEFRQATPVYHRRSFSHPWRRVQETFYLRQMWDLAQGINIFRSWRMYRKGHAPVASERTEGSAEQFTDAVKKFALEHPECDIVGITRITKAMIFDRDDQRQAVKHPWIIVLGRAMNHSELARTLKDDGKWRPFWRDRFLPEIREVMRIYARSQEASWALTDWIRGQGYDAEGHGGPRGGPVNTLVAAHAAGLGELGKHGSLLHDELGSCMRFAYVTTDLPLVADQPVDIGVGDYCAKCQACYNICPPKALFKEKQMVRGDLKWYVDFDRCVPYFNEHHGCALCISICPWSRPGLAKRLSRKTLAKRHAAAD